jgi:CRISPR-associated protein Cas2
MFVFMTYDVPAERTHLFCKLMRKYLGHEQFSVFFGDLAASRCEKLRLEVKTLMIPGDKIVEFVAENRNNIDIKFWSKDGSGTGVPKIVSDLRHKSDTHVL